MANLQINAGQTLDIDNYSFGTLPNQLRAELEPAGPGSSFVRFTWFTNQTVPDTDTGEVLLTDAVVLPTPPISVMPPTGTLTEQSQYQMVGHGDFTIYDPATGNAIGTIQDAPYDFTLIVTTTYDADTGTTSWVYGVYVPGNPWSGFLLEDDTVTLADGNDNFVDPDGQLTLDAGDGDDTIFAAGSATVAPEEVDFIQGGAGNDSIQFQGGGHTIDGGSGNDQIGGGSSNSGLVTTLIGGEGDDTVYGSFEDDRFVEADANGNDTYVGQTGSDTVDYSAIATGGVTVSLGLGFAAQDTGAAGIDTIVEIENIVGTGQADQLTGSAGDNQIDAAGGDDTVHATGGNDRLDGGAGEDTVVFSGTEADYAVSTDEQNRLVVASAGGTSTLTGFEWVQVGSNVYDFAMLLAGAPVITSDGGGDEALLAVDENTLAVTTVTAVDPNSSDTLSFEIIGGEDGGFFEIDATTGALRFRSFEYYPAPNFEDPRDTDGDNVYNVTVRVSDGHGNFDVQTISVAINDLNTVHIEGTSGADLIDATHTVAGEPFPGNEDDDIYGFGGDDVIASLEGNDRIVGGDGADTIDGGAGDDLVDYSDEGGAGGVVVNLSGIDFDTGNGDPITIAAHSAIDSFGNVDTLTNIENARGTSQNDVFVGTDEINRFEGLGGGDIVIGGSRDDFFNAGSGNDSFDGGGPHDADVIEYWFNGESQLHGITLVQDGDDSGTVIDPWGDTDTFVNVETVVGSAFSDSFTGAWGNDRFVGADGADSFDGQGGRDWIDYYWEQGNQQATGIIANLSEVAIGPVSIAGRADISLGAGEILDTYGNVDTTTSIEQITGTSLQDLMIGGEADNIFDAEEGDDILLGNGGDDEFVGDAGADLIDGGAGHDQVNYRDETKSFKVLPGSHGVIVNLSGAATDVLSVDGIGPQVVAAHTAIDTHGQIDTLLSIERVRGSEYDDIIIGNDDENDLQGNEGDDLLIGGGADDFGADFFVGGRGNDTMIGGVHEDEFNRVQYAGETDWGPEDIGEHGVIVNLSASALLGVGVGGIATTDVAAGTAIDSYGDTDTLVRIQNADGTQYDDIIVGGDGHNDFDGRGGNDLLIGGNGANNLRGGDGNDTLIGGSEDDFIDGGRGDDIADGGGNGEGEYDNLEYREAEDGITVSKLNRTDGTVTGIWAGNDSFTNIEIVVGSNHDDVFNGSSEDDDFTGNAGADLFNGGDGRDRVVYEKEQWAPGGDNSHGVIVNLSGATISADTGQGQISVDAGRAVDGFGDIDTLDSIEVIQGTRFDDHLQGGDGGNELQGREGDDTLIGGNGRDQLQGDDGNDTLVGGDGDDDLDGGRGDDTVLAGGGNFDNIKGTSGTDTVDGGDGFDQLHYLDDFDPLDHVHVVLDASAPGSGTVTGEIDGIAVATSFTALERVIGTAGSDTFLAQAGFGATGESENTFWDGRASDGRAFTFVGGDGNDSFTDASGIEGGVSVINYDEEKYSTPQFGHGNFHAWGSEAGEHGVIVNLSAVAQTALGFDLNDGGSPVDVTVAAGKALDIFGSTDTIDGIRAVILTETGDRFFGSDSGNYVQGRDGDDVIIGGNGRDLLNGDAGNDTILGGGDDDSISGWLGDDTLAGGAGNDWLGAGIGNDTVDGGSGFDVLGFGWPQPQGPGEGIAVTLGGSAPGGGTITGTISDGHDDQGNPFTGTVNTGFAGIERVEGTSGNDSFTVASGYLNTAEAYRVFTPDRGDNRGSNGIVDISGGAGNDIFADLSDTSPRGDSGGSMLVSYDGDKWGTGNYDGHQWGTGAGEHGVVVNLSSVARTILGYDLNDGSAPAALTVAAGTGFGIFGETDQFIGVQAVWLTDTDDWFWADDNRDSFVGGAAGDDHLFGGAGDDVFFGGDGIDAIAGGDGHDVVRYDWEGGSLGVLVYLMPGSQTFPGMITLQSGEVRDSYGNIETLSGIEEIIGSRNGDRLWVGDGGYVIDGGEGGDEIITGAGADILIGDEGDDHLDAGDGNDVLHGGSGNDTLDGREGDDEIHAGDDHDTLAGRQGADLLFGDAGNDFIAGSVGNDEIHGGAGDDTLIGGSGDDVIDGGEGDETVGDTVDYAAEPSHEDAGGPGGPGGGIVVNLSDAAIVIGGDSFAAHEARDVFGGTDTLIGIENVRGTGHDDVIVGDDGNNGLLGGNGSDVLRGNGGADTLEGQAGEDILEGGGGDDTLYGSLDDDHLTGGAGDDFIHGGADIDTVQFSGERADYAVAAIAGGGISVTDLRLGDNDGTDTVYDTEFFQFADMTVSAEGLFNSAPEAAGDALSASEDAPLVTAVGDLLANDTDPDSGQTLSIVSVGGATHGTVELVGGDVVFTPDTDFAGIASYTYFVEDGAGGSDSATVSIDVAPVADAPALAIGPHAAPDFWTPVLEQTAIEQNTSGMQHAATAAPLADGGYAIAWMYPAEANNLVASVRVFNADGTPRSNDILLEEGGLGSPYPTIAGLADGGFVVAWYALGHPEDDGGYGVYGQRYDAAGVPVGSEFAVANSAAFYETNPSVIGLADGGFAVAWYQELSAGGFPTDNGVWLSTYDAAGELVTTVHVANQEAPSIATLADGAIVVAYGEGDVAASVLETDGTPRGAPVSLSGGVGLNIFPSVAGLAGGGYVTTWAHYTGGASNYDVWARVVDDSGNAGPTFEVTTSMDLSSQHGAQVTALADGSFVIAWTSLGEDGSGLGVYARHYDASGAPIGPQQLIPAQTLGNQQIGYDMGEIDHGIVQLADGRLLVTWMDGSKDDGGLVARIFAASTAGSGPGAGDEDTAIALPLITVAAADTDGSETLVLRLSGFPAGTGFSLGALDAGSGDWVIDDPADIAALAGTPLLATPPANFNGNFELTVTAVSTDSATLSSGGATDTASTSASFTVIVHPVDDQPSITSDGGGDTAALSRAENGTLVTTVTAADPDGGGGSFTYTISSGADAALFAIDAGTGVLSFIAAPDHEMPADADGDNVYEVVVSASDGALTDMQSISVTVTDVGGVTINGTNAADLIDATHSPAGQPLPTDEADTINGNGGNDTLWGLAGNDTLNGGTGSDTMRGGAGNDTYVVDAVGDVVIETPGEGTDTVLSSVSTTLAAEVENLTLTGTGNTNGTGNGLDNILLGNGGNNTLNGGLGADQMAGGLGNDIYVVDNAGDLAIELANEGTDTVQAAISYTIGDNIENLTLTGSTAIDGTGNAANNTVTGNAGANTLDGGGGTDTLIGGLGNDTYIVDEQADVVTEAANAGIDTVQFTGSGSYTLSNSVENLVLGVDASGGTGNALANAITGNASDNLLSGGAGADILAGLGGNDTYIVDNAGDTIIELAGEGRDLVIASVSHTLGAGVEDLTLSGTGAISGTGNDLDNVLTGNSGANTLDGGLGADTMVGGAGNDTYVVDDAGDVVDEATAGGSGTDTILATISFDLGSAGVLGDVERLTLVGTGNIGGTGNGLANVITGNAGNNLLDGNGGSDTLAGGLGDDTYVTDGGDTITEATDAGIDTVISSVNLTLGANLENLTLVGGAVTGTGNALNNVITGNALGNTLSGGLGDDTLAGGLGDDVYAVDSIGDTVVEAADAGTDLVQASVSHTLSANVENLTLTGSAASAGTGNDLGNVIIGNSAANTLSGGGGNDTLIGGAGADSMAGGTGDDLYIVDNIGDTAVEAVDEGTDLVQSSVSFTLGDHVENLTLTGAAAINATGNAGANTLTGNAGNNTLNGGAGADLMIGGAANDTYVVDDAGDVVDELGNGGAGTDTVQASISFSLADATHVLGEVERLTLTGTGNLNGTGNAANNVITGNSGSNILDGGAGVDTLIGGLGNDTYIVDSVSDIVTEAASAGTDTVQFAGTAGTFILGANVENLTLVGNAAIDGSGNSLANVLTGNAASNTLSGGGGNDTLDGGMGADILIGGAGNDTYVVDDAADRVDEATGGSGTDTVRSSVSFSLIADGVHVLGNVEALVLTGTAAVSGTGNALDNTLIGNQAANHLFGGAGDDTLIGGGGTDRLIAGLGHDMLFGGAGADTFDFNVADFGGAGGVVANHSDSIFDYSGAGGEGDVLDLAGLLDDAYSLVGGDSAQLLRAVFSGSDVIVEINENAVLNGSAVNTDWSAAFTLHDVADPGTVEATFAGQTWHLDAGTGLFGL